MIARRLGLLVLLTACGSNPQEPVAPAASAVVSAAPTSTVVVAPPAASSVAPAPAKVVDVGPDLASQKQSYFPLVEGATYTYRGTFQGHSDEKKIVTKREGKAFYFFELGRTSENPIVGSNMPGAGSYAWKDGDVLTGKAFWKKDLASTDPTAMFLPKDPEKGKSLTFNTGDHDVTFKFRGTKKVKVPAGEFADALDVELTAEGARGDVVFAKGVGVIYWKRQTGRVDELVSFELPK